MSAFGTAALHSTETFVSWIVGKITLPSTILKFWDLGGQRGIRSIWHRYYDDCHAVVFVIDAEDRERLSEGWEVFGVSIISSAYAIHSDDG